MDNGGDIEIRTAEDLGRQGMLPRCDEGIASYAENGRSIDAAGMAIGARCAGTRATGRRWVWTSRLSWAMIGRIFWYGETEKSTHAW